MLDTFDAVYVQICGHRSKLLHWSMERASTLTLSYESAKCSLDAPPSLPALARFNLQSSTSSGKGTNKRLFSYSTQDLNNP